jgi:hypothetical protein
MNYKHPRSPPLKQRELSESSDDEPEVDVLSPKRIKPAIFNSELVMEDYDRDPRDTIELDKDGNEIDPVGVRCGKHDGNEADDDQDSIDNEEETEEESEDEGGSEEESEGEGGSGEESEDDGMGDGTEDNPMAPPEDEDTEMQTGEPEFIEARGRKRVDRRKRHTLDDEEIRETRGITEPHSADAEIIPLFYSGESGLTQVDIVKRINDSFLLYVRLRDLDKDVSYGVSNLQALVLLWRKKWKTDKWTTCAKLFELVTETMALDRGTNFKAVLAFYVLAHRRLIVLLKLHQCYFEADNEHLEQVRQKINLVYNMAEKTLEGCRNEFAAEPNSDEYLHLHDERATGVMKMWVDIVHHRIKFDHITKKVAIWDKKQRDWLIRSPNFLTKHFVDVLKPLAATMDEGKFKQEVIQIYTTPSRFRTLVDLVLPYLAETTDPTFFESLDPVNHLIAINGGMVGDMRTGLIRQREMEDMFTHGSKSVIHPRDHPLSLVRGHIKHLCKENGVEKPKKEALLSHILGYVATPETGRKEIVFGTGCRNSGKSLLFGAAIRAIGPRGGYAKEGLICYNPKFPVKIDSDDCTPGIFTAKRRTCVLIEEVSTGSVLHNKKARMHQGAPTLTGRRPHAREDEEFPNTCKIVILGNTRFGLEDGTSEADAKVTTIEFLNPYDMKNPDVAGAARMLQPEFQAEMLSLMFGEGFKCYQPDVVWLQAESEDVSTRYLQDPFSKFVTRCLTVGGNKQSWIITNELFPAYQRFCEENDLTVDRKAQKFATDIKVITGDVAVNRWFGDVQIKVRYNVQWNITGFTSASDREVVVRDEKGAVVIDRETERHAMENAFTRSESLRSELAAREEFNRLKELKLKEERKM